SPSRSNSSEARTLSPDNLRQAAEIAAIHRLVGSILPIRIRSRCCRLYPDSLARWAGLIPLLFRNVSSRVLMCNIVHYSQEQDGCQSGSAQIVICEARYCASLDG